MLQKKTECIDFINEHFRKEGLAERHFKDVDAAVRENSSNYLLSIVSQNSDYLALTASRKHHEIALIVLGMSVTGLLLVKESKKTDELS